MKPEILNAIEEYKTGLFSLAKLAGKYLIDRTHLSNVLKKLNITITNKLNLVRVNEHIFDTIDTEEKAYWLGFLFADGNISSKGNKIELSLSSKDKKHLIKFKLFLDYKGDIKISSTNFKNSNRCRLIFSSKILHSVLNNYGCTPNKSLTLQFPDVHIFENKDLIRHFIRGYIDGDGCLSYQNKDHTIANISILGTSTFLSEMLKYLPIQSNIYNRKNISTVNVARHKAFLLANYIYNNSSIYLERKYLKYKEYCRLYEKSCRLLESKIGEDCDVNTEQTIDITKGSIAA